MRSLWPFFFLLSAFWSIQFQDKGVEAIRTSDTTDTFYSIVINARDLHTTVPASLLTQILEDQIAALKTGDLESLYHGQFNAYLKSVYLATGDVANAYKLLVGPLNFVYLVGCYLLFLAIGGTRKISLAFAILASFPIFIPIAGENFGMGPFTNFSRRHLFTAFVPIALYLFYRYRSDVRYLTLVFAFLGIIANLHASGILLIEIALITILLWYRTNRRSLINVALFLLTSCLTGFIALGSIWSVIGNFVSKLIASFVPSAYAMPANMKAGIPVEL